MDWVAVQAVGAWVGALGAIGALVFFSIQTISLARQTKSLVDSYRFDSQWRRNNKSAELALFYAQSVLPLITYCSSVLEKTDIYPRLKSISPKRMARFNSTELKEVFGSDEDIERLVKESVKKLNPDAFISERRLVPLGFRDELVERLLSQEEQGAAEEEELKVALQREFGSVTTILLNDLEYFSMCINSGIADGDILYPSLHQTYFKMISIFYFRIASHNTSMKDKFYTHIIQLSTSWKERFVDDERKESQVEDEMSRRYLGVR